MTTLGALGASELRIAVVILLGWACARLLASSSAALRHGVWTATIAGVLLLPAAHLLLPDVRAPFAAPVARWIDRVLAGRMEGGAHVRPAPIGSSESAALNSALDLGEAVAQGPARPSGDFILLAVWLAGAALMVGRMARANWHAQRVVNSANAVDDARLLELHAELARRAGLAHPPRLLETASIGAPATFGIVRPVVLLPSERSWSAESAEARSMLSHELAHVARRDCLTNVFTQLARALHWFNPLIWFAERRVRCERERACDDRVLAGGAVAGEYAALLVAVVRASRQSANVPAAALAMARHSELESRLIAILDSSHHRRSLGRRGAIALAFAAAIAVAAASVVRLEAAPVQGVAPDAPAPQSLRREPDTRGDSLALPWSERIDSVSAALAESRSRTAVRGPDSTLARTLRAALGRRSHGPADLVRERAAWALSQTRDGLLIEPLIFVLGNDSTWRVRAYAAWSLGVARDVRAVPALIAQLNDPVWRLRAMAADALANIGDPRARTAMEDRFSDEAWQVRIGVVRYLRSFNDDGATRLVRRAREDRHVAVRNEADAG